MFLYLGKNKSVDFDDIVGVFDMDSATQTPAGRAFLTSAQNADKLSTVLDGFAIPKSFVVTTDGRVIISQYSAASIRARLGDGFDIGLGELL